MLAQAVDRGLSTHDYLDPQHPVQIAIRQRLAELGGITFDEIGVGVDGCSAPCFAMPLRAAALAFARLAEAARWSGRRRLAACGAGDDGLIPRWWRAKDGSDTDLMRAVPGRVVSKGGAEGYHGMGCYPARWISAGHRDQDRRWRWQARRASGGD